MLDQADWAGYVELLQIAKLTVVVCCTFEGDLTVKRGESCSF